jgi:hypothetical protein
MAFRVNGVNTIITSTSMGLGTTSPNANVAIIASTPNALISLDQSGSGPALNVARGSANFYDNVTIFSNFTVTGNVNFSGGANTYWTSANDGAGSTLDADLVDGLHANAFSNASNLTSGTIANARISGAYTGITGLGTLATLTLTGNIAAGNISLSGQMNTAGPIRVGSNTVWHQGNLDIGSNTAWHSGNDGSGSGLDADLLDGNNSSFFTNATNMSAGTLPNARLNGDYSFGGLTLANTITVSGGNPIDPGVLFSTGHGFSSDAQGIYIGNADRIHTSFRSSLGLTFVNFLSDTNGVYMATEASRTRPLSNGEVVWSLSNYAHSSANLEVLIGGIQSTLVDGRNSTEDSRYQFYVVSGGIPTTMLTLNGASMMTTVGSALTTTGQITIGSNTAWHSGNDGEGSTLDANTSARLSTDHVRLSNSTIISFSVQLTKTAGVIQQRIGKAGAASTTYPLLTNYIMNASSTYADTVFVSNAVAFANGFAIHGTAQSFVFDTNNLVDIDDNWYAIAVVSRPNGTNSCSALDARMVSRNINGTNIRRLEIDPYFANGQAWVANTHLANNETLSMTIMASLI